MVEIDKPSAIFQLHVMLKEINPPIWRRILMRSDSSIADLHYIIQVAFNWSDFHLHHFLIRGKEYGISREGGTSFMTNAKKVYLADFHFRPNERFLYEYDFGDLWQHQVRFECTQPVHTKRAYPVCIGGSRAAPPEDCGGPWAYMEEVDRHRFEPPQEELQLLAKVLKRLVKAEDHEKVGDLIGEPDALREAVDRVKEYTAFRPNRFDRRGINRRLKLYGEGNEEWMWQ